MSVPRCLRCAVDICRPAKRVHLQIRPLQHARTYADQARPSKQKDSIPSSAPSKSRRDQTKDAPPKPAITPDPPATAPRPLPPNVLAAFRTPHRHPPSHEGTPTCSLQLRSYSVRNLEFFADFAMRVAAYLQLSARGPVPLPRKIERWTMPRANFVHKKSQENFERITLRRNITILDGEKSVVEVWLACLRKWQFYGVGMKANVWEYEGLDVATKMDKQAKDIEKELDAMLSSFGWNKSVVGDRSIQELLIKEGRTAKGAPLMQVRDDIKLAKNVEL